MPVSLCVFSKDNVQGKKRCDHGSYDRTELCELVGFYLLDLLTKEYSKQNIGLYRDDVLSCFENISCPDS